jgi:hypothetical protein
LIAGRFSPSGTVWEIPNAIIRSPIAGNIILPDPVSRNSSSRPEILHGMDMGLLDTGMIHW